MNYLSIYSIADRILNQNKKRTHFSAFFVIKVFVIISTTTTIICICMCVYTIYSRECLKVAATRVCWISKSTFITFVSEKWFSFRREQFKRNPLYTTRSNCTTHTLNRSLSLVCFVSVLLLSCIYTHTRTYSSHMTWYISFDSTVTDKE